MLNRRHLLAGAGAFAGLSLASTLRTASAAAVDASTFGVKPGATDQTRGFARMLAAASDKNLPVFLPAGTYVVAGLTLPNNVRLSGVAGATRIVLGGDGFLMMATEAAHIELTDLVIDGGDRLLSDGCKGLVDLRNVGQLAIDSCGIVASGKSGLYLERCAGRVERSTISGAADYGLYSVQAAGLAISGNSVSDCANGGILVHRWEVGEDGTLVTGNRVTRIAARGGGTGQYGNGINVFRADNVVVSGNIVSDCAFSAIRANSASNIQVSGNTCLRSGETAIYAEFAFQGAVIDGNIVDGAANGISVVNFNEGGRTAICSGNIVRNLSVVGPYPPDAPGFGAGISVEADTTVSGNVVENAPLYGIKIGWGPYMRNVVATGNIVRRARTGIAVTVVEGAGGAIISDNVISETTDGAIVGFRWTDAASGDLSLPGAESFSHLTISGNHAG
jgi:uncharacterized secreted repeat protein (TIGR03808 family)